MSEKFTCGICYNKHSNIKGNAYNYNVCYHCKTMICKGKECGYKSADFFGSVYKCVTCYAN